MLKAAVTYFAMVFGTGFALGVIRVPFLVPRLGVRTAELLEMPFMLLAILFSARYVVRRYPLPRQRQFATGLIALTFVVGAELSLILLQGQSLGSAIAQRDPVSGSVYLALLAIFALMPYAVSAATKAPAFQKP